jgi:hypothetical protein
MVVWRGVRVSSGAGGGDAAAGAVVGFSPSPPPPPPWPWEEGRVVVVVGWGPLDLGWDSSGGVVVWWCMEDAVSSVLGTEESFSFSSGPRPGGEAAPAMM